MLIAERQIHVNAKKLSNVAAWSVENARFDISHQARHMQCTTNIDKCKENTLGYEERDRQRFVLWLIVGRKLHACACHTSPTLAIWNRAESFASLVRHATTNCFNTKRSRCICAAVNTIQWRVYYQYRYIVRRRRFSMIS